MTKIGLRIESNYSYHERKRHYIEDTFLDLTQMRWSAPAEHLRRLFPHGAGISVQFEVRRVIIKSVGVRMCKLDDQEMREGVNYIIFPGQKKVLRVDNLSFTIETFTHHKSMKISRPAKVIFLRP